MVLAPPQLLSVVAPLYNEEENIHSLYQRLCAVLTTDVCQNYELVLVDNGSSDRTLTHLKELNRLDPNVRYLSLSRNYGHQGGLIAGLEHAKGEVVVSMDGDLQHPPELIPQMVIQWQQGFDVVFTLKKENKSSSFWRKQSNRFFYATMSRLSGLKLVGGQSDFRLMGRTALDALLSLPERDKFLRGLSQWIGFKQTGIPFDVEERFKGRSKFQLKDLFRFAINGIFSFSVLPLRLFTFIGIIVAGFSLLHVAYALLRTWYKMSMGLPYVEGFPTLASGVFFLGGIQLIGIGLLGEYLGRIHNEVKRRPVYILREIAPLLNITYPKTTEAADGTTGGVTVREHQHP